MPFVEPVEYEDASPEVREVFDDILARRGTGDLSPFLENARVSSSDAAPSLDERPGYLGARRPG